MWELWSYKYGDLNMHMIGRYLLERQEFEQTRWLPDLTVAQKTIPVHICWGDQDDVCLQPMAKVLHEEVCPKAKLTWIKDTGHFLEQENPKEVSSQCLQWWRSLK